MFYFPFIWNLWWFFFFFFLHTCLLSIVRAPVFGRHQFFGTSEHYGKAHGSLLSGWMNYNYTACCWFPTSSNILILPSQFWRIGFENCWLYASKCRILVLLRYLFAKSCDYAHSPSSSRMVCSGLQRTTAPQSQEYIWTESNIRRKIFCYLKS